MTNKPFFVDCKSESSNDFSFPVNLNNVIAITKEFSDSKYRPLICFHITEDVKLYWNFTMASNRDFVYEEIFNLELPGCIFYE